MTDHDQSLGGDSAASSPFGNPAGDPKAAAALETILSLDEVMSSARLVERTAKICLRGDLQAEFNTAVEQLSTLVDPDGNVRTSGDEALSDASDANELMERIEQIRSEMAAATRTVRFRAMPDDDWRAFEKANRTKDDALKDADDYNRKIIARCAIAPTMTEADVDKLREKLGPVQMTALANAAYWACTTGGLDVPKLPHFSLARRQPAPGRN